MTRRELLTLLALLAVGFILGFIGGCKVSALRQKDLEVERDTVKKVVTAYKDFPQPVKAIAAGMIPVPKYLFFTDSIPFEVPVPGPTEYVYLPREQKYYEEADGHLRMWVSGYDPRLDKYEWDAITTTITQTYNAPKRHWGAGAAGGYGVTVFEGKAVHGPSASVFGFYNFNRFGLGVSGELNTAAYNGGLLATPSVKVFGFFTW